MECNNCGKKIEDGDTYCQTCEAGATNTKNIPWDHFFHFNGIGLKNTVTGWFYGAWQLLKKDPVYFIGMGLVIMGLTLIPGLNVLAILLSGAILGISFSIVKMIDRGEHPTIAKLQSLLSDMWIYLVLIQLIFILMVSFASIFFWVPAIFVAAFLLFVIPIAVNEPATIIDVIESSFYLSRSNYWPVFAIVLALSALNLIAYSVFPLFLCVSIPYTLCVIHVAFIDLLAAPQEINELPTAITS